MVSSPAIAVRPVTVVLVDDHELIRRGVRQVLSSDRGIKVVGEAFGSSDALSMIGRVQPDVVILDIRLGQGSGLDVIKAIKAVAPSAKILVLSAYDYDKYVGSFLKLGASGYLLKTASAQELKKAVHDAAEGRFVLGHEIAGKIVSFFRRSDAQVPGGAETWGNLTQRETEVLELMGQGLRNREIGESMGISLKTVEAHVEHILLKLGARSRMQAVLSVFKKQYLHLRDVQT